MKLTCDTKLLEIEIKMLSTWTQGQLTRTGKLTAVNPWVKSEIIHLFCQFAWISSLCFRNMNITCKQRRIPALVCNQCQHGDHCKVSNVCEEAAEVKDSSCM